MRHLIRRKHRVIRHLYREKWLVTESEVLTSAYYQGEAGKDGKPLNGVHHHYPIVFLGESDGRPDADRDITTRRATRRTRGEPAK